MAMTATRPYVEGGSERGREDVDPEREKKEDIRRQARWAPLHQMDGAGKRSGYGEREKKGEDEGGEGGEEMEK